MCTKTWKSDCKKKYQCCITSAEREKTVTAICSMNAIGNYIPPIFIYPRKRMHLALLKGVLQGSKGFASKSG